MNKPRRTHLWELIGALESVQSMLEDLKCEEEECRDNLPENLVGSERYEKMDDAVNALDYAIEQIDEAISNIQTAIEG